MKIKYFVNSMILLSGSILFLFYITFGGDYVYTAYYEEETFENNTFIATADISNLTHEEAIAVVETEVENWKVSAEASFRWYEQEVKSNVESIDFFVEESVTNADMNKASSYDLMAEIDVTYLRDNLSQFSFYFQDMNLVNEEQLEIEVLETAVSLPNSELELNVHEFLNSDVQEKETVLYSATRQLDSPLLEAWSNEMPEIVIEGDSRFSLSEVFEGQNIESTEGNPLSILGSAVFETLLHSNFQLVERHQPERLNEGIPLGFDTQVVIGEQDLVFDNPNPVSYELELEYDNGLLTVELIGENLPYTVTVEMEDVHDLEPKTIVNYTEQLSSGGSSVEEMGSNGTTYDIVRTFDFPENEWQVEEWIANDYYPPEHRVELRNVDDLRVTEEEEMGLDEYGNPIAENPNPDDYDSVDEFLDDYYGTETGNESGYGSTDGTNGGTNSGSNDDTGFGTNYDTEFDTGYGNDYDYDTDFDSGYGSGSDGSNSGGTNQSPESDTRWSDFWSGNGSQGTSGGTGQNGVTPSYENDSSTGGNGTGTSEYPNTNNGGSNFPREDEEREPVKGY
ncbi:hypothetical protein CR203_17770 [Salipaludibacillus neizhouensis]|uniref:G5 domain-containing protein n=1 Tax=Salipaludibacillus neizhouensis TaxID=885475 RepID=A0A3A9K6I3_9BACI|nr:VanW family protein [Salipaludibacillus neizhouensis]RKL65921.1 hypothetical protein CR203_17770 [Salipaludibacillus neizhouensis]